LNTPPPAAPAPARSGEHSEDWAGRNGTREWNFAARADCSARPVPERARMCRLVKQLTGSRTAARTGARIPRNLVTQTHRFSRARQDALECPNIRQHIHAFKSGPDFVFTC
jgi:hypothetical protein